MRLSCILPPLLAVLGLAAQDLVPLPRRLHAQPGRFTLTAATQLVAPPALDAVAETFRAQLRPAIGLRLPLQRRAGAGAIRLGLDPAMARLGPEGYRLQVGSNGIQVRSATPAGVFFGLQTLRQLLPVEVFRRSRVDGVRWTVPAVEIEDAPRFGWRGSHLDVARHFMPKDFILRHLDLMALHKLNVFHWHLTDDQGWRLQVRKYPRLVEVGGWRRDSMVGAWHSDPARRAYSGRPHGGYYTQDDVREIVRYAAERFITVVPEIEMPGHTRALLAAYPEFGNTPGPVEVATHWGVFEEVLNVEDRTLRFLQDVLEEVLELFPSKFIHLGGDEVPKKQWKESPAAQARMRELGLKDEQELQSWFVRQMDAWLAARGRRLVGWDEILEGGLAPGATVMSWRGEAGGIQAAQAGHDVVMAPGSPTYFDHLQSRDPGEPVSQGGFNPIEKVYAYDPVPAALTSAEAKHVLGAQAQLWSEYLPTERHVEYMAWPRLCALAEVLWSPPGPRDFAAFKPRLEAHLQRLAILGVNFRPLAGPYPAWLR